MLSFMQYVLGQVGFAPVALAGCEMQRKSVTGVTSWPARSFCHFDPQSGRDSVTALKGMSRLSRCFRLLAA